MSLMPIEQRRFDRLEEFDPRSRNYPIRALVPEEPVTKVWMRGRVLDQGSEGACVGFGWSAELGAEPIAVAVDNVFARRVYLRAQELDEFPETPPEEGSSVLAGAKTVVEGGFMGEYRWAFGIDDLILALGHHGPAVLGVPWLAAMGTPKPNGVLDVSGGVLGGHCICAIGVLVDEQVVGEVHADTYIVLQNSWGEDWGQGGICYATAGDVDRLLHMGGEACVPVVRRDPAAPATSGYPRAYSNTYSNTY